MTKVAILDDDTSILEVTKTLLELEGFSVETFSNSTSLLEAVSNNHYDVFILDILLNESDDGFSICRKLKMREATADIPVILFSAHSIGQMDEELQSIGCANFIEKPFDIDDMVAEIQRVHSNSF